MAEQKILIIAGPNGAGKTTFAREFLPNEAACLQFINADLAVERVRLRVTQGGHSIPEPVIRRRYVAGWQNLQQIYRALVDDWAVYDNSGATPQWMDQGTRNVTP